MATVVPSKYWQLLVRTAKSLVCGCSSHKETPGLGDKIELRKTPWVLSFNGQTVASAEDKSFAVKKDGGQFDQFAGATITPRAVVKAVKNAAVYIQQHPELASLPADCGA